jgi:hypothetical protein
LIKIHLSVLDEENRDTGRFRPRACGLSEELLCTAANEGGESKKRKN